MKHNLKNAIIQEAQFQKNAINLGVRMEQNLRKLLEIKTNFNLDLNGTDIFTEDEITNAFNGFDQKIYEQELYPIDVLFDD